MPNGLFHNTDYSDQKNRTFKVQVDSTISGYTFEQLAKWIKKWTDPNEVIRCSFRYNSLYKYHYQVLAEYLPKKCKTRLNVEKEKIQAELNAKRAAYLIDGLEKSVGMFEKIQSYMKPDDLYYKEFVWEAKVMFFSFYDFCEVKINEKI